MGRYKRWTATAVLVLAVAGCAKTPEAAELVGPATLAPVPGSDVQQVTLTAKAIERLDLQMAPVAQEGAERVIPYGAVVYDAGGQTWAYTSPKPRTFVRSTITVTRITGEKAFLSDGPAVGTPVVTVATAELYGTEAGIGY